jgi:hypothetical protein
VPVNLLTIQLVDDLHSPQPGGSPSAPPFTPPRPAATSYIPRPTDQATQTAAAAARPPAPPAAPVGVPTADDLIRSILATPGAKGFGFSKDNLSRMSPADLAELATKIGPPPPPANPPAPPAPPSGDVLRGARGPVPVEVVNWPADGYRASVPTGTATAAAPPAPPTQPTTGLDVYRFKDTADRLEAGERYDVKPPVDLPPRPPRAEPVLPKAEPVEPPPMSAAEIAQLVGRFIPGRVGQFVAGVGRQLGGAGAAEVGGATAGAAEAAAAAAGLGELAAVAGPAALAILGAKIASDTMRAGLDAAAGAVQGAGSQMQKLARNDVLGMFTDHLDNASKALDELPFPLSINAKVLAGEFKLASTAVKAYTGTVEAFNQRAREIAPFSANLSAAIAVANARNTLADAREARVLGDDMARLVEASNRRDLLLRETVLPLKAVGVKVLGAIEGRIVNTLERVAPLVERGVEVAEKAWERGPKQAWDLYKLVDDNFTAGLKVMYELVGLTRDKEKADELSAMVKQVFNLGQGLPELPAAPDPAVGAKDATALPPILGGKSP